MIEETPSDKYHCGETKSKKKKRHFGWLIALLVIAFIIALPIASLYIFVYDGGDPTPIKDYDVTTSLKQKAVKALSEEREETQKIGFSFEEKDLRGLIQNATKSLSSENKYLRGFDAKIEGNQFLFECYIGNLPLSFKSKITLCTTLSEENEDYVFHIDSFKLGKIGIGSDILSKVGASFSDEDIDNAFVTMGLHVSSNLSEGKIVYKKKDAEKDAIALLSSSSDDSLYSSLLEELIDMDLLTISSMNGLSLSMDLEPIHDNKDFLTPSKNLSLSEDLASYRDKVVTLLNSEESFRKETPYDTYLMEYLIKGYSKLSDEEKNYIKDKDFRSIGIASPLLYEGKRYAAEGKDLNALLEERKGSLLTGGIKVSEDELNLLFQDTSLLGTSYLVSAPFDGAYESSYVSVDNFYSNIVDEKISFVLGINFGGYEIPAILNFKEVDGSAMLSLKKDHFFIGEKEISENLSKTLFDLLGTALDDEYWIEVDKENQTLQIGNLSSPILGKTMEVSLKGNSIKEDGYLLFQEKISL